MTAPDTRPGFGRFLRFAIVLGIGAALGIGIRDLSRAPAAGDDHDHEHGHEADAHAHGESAGGDAVAIALSAAVLEKAGVRIGYPRSAVIPDGTEIPGEVRFDPTRVAHLTPIVTGVAREVRARLGDKVSAGQSLAVIDSRDFGQAKIDYLERREAQILANGEFERAQAQKKNTEALVLLLSSAPATEDIPTKAGGILLGETKGRLVEAYGARLAARQGLAREGAAAAKGLTTTAAVAEAERALSAAEAEYTSAVESATLTAESVFLTAQAKKRGADAALRAAERHLVLLGFAAPDLPGLADEPAEMLARYELRSPIAGVVVREHLTVGERVSPEADPFVVADPASVWFEAGAAERDLRSVVRGGRASVVLSAYPERRFDGTVVAIGGALDERTRTLPFDVLLENADLTLRPGMFGKVVLRGAAEDGKESLVCPLDAVQSIGGVSVVFVVAKDGAASRPHEGVVTFSPRPVVLGRRFGGDVLVLAGLLPTDEIALANAFILKAEAGKGAVDHDH